MPNKSEGAAPAGTGNGSQIALLTSAGKDEVGAGLQRAQDGQAIYPNSALLGFIVDRRQGCDAITATGLHLGRFNDNTKASLALLQRIAHPDNERGP